MGLKWLSPPGGGGLIEDLRYRGIEIRFLEKNVGTTHAYRSSPAFTLFQISFLTNKNTP